MSLDKDFKPGDKLRLNPTKFISDGVFTVLDPVRTSRGKLRLKGPRGGYRTSWWRPEHIERGLIRRVD